MITTDMLTEAADWLELAGAVSARRKRYRDGHQ